MVSGRGLFWRGYIWRVNKESMDVMSMDVMSMDVMSMEHGLNGLDTDLKGFFRVECQKIVMSILQNREFP